jgi:DHA1 family bicyclomycin/chloramphenicol resistance-like MFS transporter
VSLAQQASTPNDSRTHWGLVALLAALVMVSPFSVDTFYPSFPAIASEFALTDWQMQQTITIYMLPFALMTLIQGPLSDALGRRPVVLGGLLVYAAASVACVFAPSYGALLTFRALQGMSAGVGMAVGRAIVRDLHEGPEAQRLMSTITMIFGVAPALAPVIGGWIHVLLGWRSVFGFMVLIGVLLVIVSYLKLPETHPPDRRVALHAGELARTVRTIASSGLFMLLAITTGANLATILMFIGAAPAIILNHWGLGATEFAYLFLPVIVGIVGGAYISGKLAGRIPGDRQIGYGFATTIGAIALSVALHVLLESPPILAQQILITLGAAGVQLVIPVMVLHMLDLFPAVRGSAASVQTCVMLATGAFVMGAVVPAINGSMLSISVGALTVSVLSFVIWRIALRVHGPW